MDDLAAAVLAQARGALGALEYALVTGPVWSEPSPAPGTHERYRVRRAARAVRAAAPYAVEAAVIDPLADGVEWRRVAAYADPALGVACVRLRAGGELTLETRAEGGAWRAVGAVRDDALAVRLLSEGW